jgi:hypothetical protein
MPFGAFINAIPMPVFLLIHLTALIIGVAFAVQAFRLGRGTLGWAFLLYGLAEVLYITYHLDWTVILFAHTLAEVCDLLAVILVFAGAVRAGSARAAAR